MDTDGYPGRTELDRIRNWPDDDFAGLMAFAKSIWWMSDWGWDEESVEGRTAFNISTGGWSGNEEIIDAMMDNKMFWLFCWEQSRRGGHYIFKVKHGRT